MDFGAIINFLKGGNKIISPLPEEDTMRDGFFVKKTPTESGGFLNPLLQKLGIQDSTYSTKPFSQQEAPSTLAEVLSAQSPSPTPTPPAPTPTLPPDQGAMPYYEAINAAAEENDVPQDILYNLLKAESSFDPDVIYGRRESSAGAQGIGQFMPTTSAGMGFNPLDPFEAIPASARYLRSKYDEGGDDWRLALARYNAGSGNVRKYGGVPPFPETQNYIKKILGQ